MPNSYGFIKTLEDKQKNFLYNSNYMKLSWNMGYFLLKIHAQRLPTTSTLATYNIYLGYLQHLPMAKRFSWRICSGPKISWKKISIATSFWPEGSFLLKSRQNLIDRFFCSDLFSLLSPSYSIIINESILQNRWRQRTGGMTYDFRATESKSAIGLAAAAVVVVTQKINCSNERILFAL